MNDLPLLDTMTAKGLHGDRDVTVRFLQPATIINADNGAGKTTILNLLFRFLTRDAFGLFQISFDSLSLRFSDGEIAKIVPIPISEINGFPHLFRNLGRYTPTLSSDEQLQLARILSTSSRAHHIETHPFIAGIARRHRIPSHILAREILRWRRYSDEQQDDLFSSDVQNQFAKVEERVPFPLLYFPTYRRIEEDIAGLRPTDDDDGHEQLIQFAMHDVEALIANVTREIKESSLDWSTTVNGRMLSELIDDIQVDETTYERVTDVDTVSIVLDRTNRSDDKERILHLIQSNGIRDEKRRPLAYFLANLIEVYSKQRDRDNAIKSFVAVCNKYLIDNELRYDESRVEVSAVNTQSGAQVEFGNLSSGEKQIISLFSKLYLGLSEPCGIIIDEPELSLSIEWQRQLLPDIQASGQCRLLVCATHSPFIFENELDSCATVIGLHYRRNQ